MAAVVAAVLSPDVAEEAFHRRGCAGVEGGMG